LVSRVRVIVQLLLSRKLLLFTALNSNPTEDKWLKILNLSGFQELPKPGIIASNWGSRQVEEQSN